MARHSFNKDKYILLPTGDGICIALVDLASPFDLHVRLALAILKRIHEHNQKTEKESRGFQVRIGINSNHDNLVADVNDRRNIAGAGINTAQRIMSLADGGQILVGVNDYNALVQRDGYTRAFRSYTAVVKHGIEIPVYQLVDTTQPWLNNEEPGMLSEPQADLRFATLLTNPEYLRRFPAPTLQEARLALRRADFPPNAPPDVESFVETIHRISETPSIWRTDYDIHLSIERDPDEPGICRIEAVFKWVYVNHSDEDIRVPQTLYTTPALPLDGMSPERLLELHKVVVDDPSRLADFHAQVLRPGDASHLSFNINVPPFSARKKGFSFRYEAPFLPGLEHPWFLVVYSPVCGIKLTVQHPGELEPELYVFGLHAEGKDATPLKAVEKRSKSHEWTYDGWLLAQHGMCLLLSETASRHKS